MLFASAIALAHNYYDRSVFDPQVVAFHMFFLDLATADFQALTAGYPQSKTFYQVKDLQEFVQGTLTNYYALCGGATKTTGLGGVYLGSFQLTTYDHNKNYHTDDLCDVPGGASLINDP